MTMIQRCVLFVMVLHVTIAFACTSDCTSCHPKLDIINDVRHQALSTCAQCHPPESFKNVAMQTGCGTDCFACHSTKKLIATPQHKVIQACIACHTVMDKNPFVGQEPVGMSQDASLKGFLKQ